MSDTETELPLVAETKKTIITWATEADQIGNAEAHEERTLKVVQMQLEGKTNRVFNRISDVCSERHWLDQAAAEEYVDYITELAQRYDLNLVSAEIADI